jgi:hypothetical protein
MPGIPLNPAFVFPASRLRAGLGFLDSTKLSVRYPADSNTFLWLVFRPCGGEQGDEGRRVIEGPGWVVFFALPERLLCRGAAEN